MVLDLGGGCVQQLGTGIPGAWLGVPTQLEEGFLLFPFSFAIFLFFSFVPLED